MRSASAYLQRRTELSRRHGLGRLEVANAIQWAGTMFHCGQWRQR